MVDVCRDDPVCVSMGDLEDHVPAKLIRDRGVASASVDFEPHQESRVLELFAGIGGMRVALAESGVRASVAAAFEISQTCEKAYLHNFAEDQRSWHLATIEHVSAAQLDALCCDTWLMSPPCQPFSRSGNKLDDEDNRTTALLHLIELLPQLRFPPRRVLLENVIGFEKSESRRKWLEALAAMDWEAAEFDLRPEDFGLPNSRPRYYGLFRAPGCPSASLDAPSVVRWRPAQEALQDSPPVLQRHRPPEFADHVGAPLGSLLQSAEEVLREESDMNCSLEVSQDTLSSFISKGGRYDIHLRSDCTSACFTKNYGRFPRGYGPMVLLDIADEVGVEQRPKLTADLDSDHVETYNVWREGSRVRYLTPTEQLRLMGYPAWYTFPQEVPWRKRFAMIGNSVNVRIIVWLVRHLLGAALPPE